MPDYDPNHYHRRSIRLKGYDYRQESVYCVTICTHGRECMLGMVRESDEMVLSAYGAIVEACWANIPTHFPQVELDAFVVMPNHVHAIVVITENIAEKSQKKMDNGQTAENAEKPQNNEKSDNAVGAQYIAPLQPPSNTFARIDKGSLGLIVRTYKAAVTREINRLRNTPSSPVWQRNYYEQIIHNERMLNNFRTYIDSNPAHWALDRYHKEIV
jgi:putative transposase